MASGLALPKMAHSTACTLALPKKAVTIGVASPAASIPTFSTRVKPQAVMEKRAGAIKRKPEPMVAEKDTSGPAVKKQKQKHAQATPKTVTAVHSPPGAPSNKRGKQTTKQVPRKASAREPVQVELSLEEQLALEVAKDDIPPPLIPPELSSHSTARARPIGESFTCITDRNTKFHPIERHDTTDIDTLCADAGLPSARTRRPTLAQLRGGDDMPPLGTLAGEEDFDPTRYDSCSSYSSSSSGEDDDSDDDDDKPPLSGTPRRVWTQVWSERHEQWLHVCPGEGCTHCAAEDPCDEAPEYGYVDGGRLVFYE